MERITSQQNKWVKHCKKLNKRKYREEHGEYLIEGIHLIEEALRYAPNAMRQLLVTDQAQSAIAMFPVDEVYLITEDISQSISATRNPQGIFAVMTIPKSETVEFDSNALVILDGVQDPGNVGTIIRTADAAGYGGVILGTGSADLYNDKVLRSMQGSHFHIPVVQTNLIEKIIQLKKAGFSLYGTKLDPFAKNYRELHPTDKYAIVLGNEGQGVSAEILELMDQNVYIPIKGKAESLNVAVAGGILMYQFMENV